LAWKTHEKWASWPETKNSKIKFIDYFRAKERKQEWRQGEDWSKDPGGWSSRKLWPRRKTSETRFGYA